MLTNVMERSREVKKTVDVVQHILAIAERERRKRALKCEFRAIQEASPKSYHGKLFPNDLTEVRRWTGMRN